ncbi:MAG: NAD(P)H nitroreductase, partial [Bacteroidetes bacterium HGW-Bacteroidetes-6]
MSFRELILTRQSVRKYASTPVETEKINQCLEAARLAPSASNSQPWHF